MMKLTTIASVLLALGLLGAGSTSGQDGREDCLKDVAEVCKSAEVTNELVEIVGAMRKAKPDFINLELQEGLERFEDFDYRPIESAACSSLLDSVLHHFLSKCLTKLEPLGRLFSDLAAVAEEPEKQLPVIEALAACAINEELMDLQHGADWKCAKRAASILIPQGTEEIASLVPKDVDQLMIRLRVYVPKLMVIYDGRVDIGKFKPIYPKPAGCDELKKRFSRVDRDEKCFDELNQPLRTLVLAIPELKPVAEAYIACLANDLVLQTMKKPSNSG